MTSRRKAVLVASELLLAFVIVWFYWLRGGYQVELWLARFDQRVWAENQMQGMRSPRRPMVKSLVRLLHRGMSRSDVESIIGKPDYEMRGWQAYKIGYPRWWATFDYDVFEVLYERDHLMDTRVRNT